MTPSDIASVGTAIVIVPKATLPAININSSCNIQIARIDSGSIQIPPASSTSLPVLLTLTKVICSRLSLYNCKFVSETISVVGATENWFEDVTITGDYVFGHFDHNIRLIRAKVKTDKLFILGGLLTTEDSYLNSDGFLLCADSSGNLCLLQKTTRGKLGGNIKQLNATKQGFGCFVNQNSFLIVNSHFENLNYGIYAKDLGKVDEAATYTNVTTSYSPSPKNTRGNNEGVII
jgi:hypothetical protein